jgi:hypothetical protein
MRIWKPLDQIIAKDLHLLCLVSIRRFQQMADVAFPPILVTCSKWRLLKVTT